MTEEIVTESIEAPANDIADIAQHDASVKTNEPAEEAAVEYSFTAPEGVSYNEDFINDFVAISKTAKLTNEQSQAVLDGIQPLFMDLTARGLEIQEENWAKASLADAEIGGDDMPKNLAMAEKAMSTFASEEFVNIMKNTGLGEHPEIIRFLVRVGKALAEDEYVQNDNTPAAPVGANRYDAMYPNHPA